MASEPTDEMVEAAAEAWADATSGKPPCTVSIGQAMRAALTAALEVQSRTHVHCTHEAYLGQCAHCGVQIRNGRAILAAQLAAVPDLDSDEEAFS